MCIGWFAAGVIQFLPKLLQTISTTLIFKQFISTFFLTGDDVVVPVRPVAVPAAAPAAPVRAQPLPHAPLLAFN